MSQIRVHFVNPAKMIEFYVNKDINSLAIGMFVEGMYEPLTAGEISESGEAAAEEIFDISNNPSRGAERYEMFGRCRSVSVGDIVEVDDELFLCASFGWQKLSVETA